jgi:hypothetical protein
MVRLAIALSLSLILASASASASASAAERLGAYPVDPAQVSVSGLSSGAFMANQLHIAHSAEIMGAAMIAGGLYGCAVLHATAEGGFARQIAFSTKLRRDFSTVLTVASNWAV